MKGRTGSALAFICFATMAGPAFSAGLPAIKVSDDNPVPQCATPGRLVKFLKSRNSKLDSRYEEIGTDYMRYGEELGVRWDIAFFQMMLETGNLTYTGDVKPRQNNFAGLGATGRKEPGESFKDIASGVHAHLQHVLMYTGEVIDNPVAERTRLVQEWGVLTKWRKAIKGPLTYSQLAKQWAPGSRRYARDIGELAEDFYDTVCKESDPQPELVAEARKGRTANVAAATQAPPPAVKPAENAAAPATSPPANNVNERAAALAAKLSPPSGATAAAAAGAAGATSENVGFKLLNAPAEPSSATAEASSSAVAATPAVVKDAKAKPDPKTGKTAEPSASVETASLAAGAAKSGGASATGEKSATGKQACRVWTASYGGTKAVIVKSIKDKLINYTVLDVNEGAERRETAAYIAAYAKGGELVGEFTSQNQALDKAFKLCPDG